MRTKLVVIDSHTLGYITPNNNVFAGVLHASVLKGASSSCPLSSMCPVSTRGRHIRLASEKDFNEFRVSFEGFNNEKEYEFQK